MAGGHDCNFLSEPPESLKCLICLSVAKDPRQHEGCGKLFCSECIEKYGTRKPCPNCKQTGTQFYKDHKSKREIDELKVKCDNSERNCVWQGTIETRREHVGMCKFALLPCPKGCRDERKEVQHFARKDLEKHLKHVCPHRDYNCKYCEEKGTYASITQVHVNMCPKQPLPCPNGCSATVERRYLKKHVNARCELDLVRCKYKPLGCDCLIARRDIAAHERDYCLHLCMAVDTTLALKNKTVELERDLKETKDKLQKSETALKFKLINFQKTKNKDGCVQSPSYNTSPQGYHLALKVYPNGHESGRGTHVSVFAAVLKGEYDAQLKWPLIGQVTFTLLNQLEDKNHFQRKGNLTADVKERAGLLDFIPHSALGYNPLKNTQYLKDDTLYFRMSVELAYPEKPWLQ